MPEETKILPEKIRNIEKDFEFDKLELKLKTSNIFRILRITKTEIRHSNFLSWLLDPTESHNLREIFLKRFLIDLDIHVEDLKYQKVEIRREWRNIDLLIIFSNDIVCIENKIDSKEHSNQLKRYKEIINENFKEYNKYYVYLTPSGSEPSDSEYEIYSYHQIMANIDHVLEVFNRNLTDEVAQYMKDYSEILKIEIMKEHEINDLAIKVYNRHKEAFDFIFDNKPDLTSDAKLKYEKKIMESGWVLGTKGKQYVRFHTRELDRIIPRTAGWTNKEGFLFEIILDGKSAIFKTTISPGDGSENHEKVREILTEQLEKIEGSKTPYGKKWLVHYMKKFKYNLELILEKSDDEIDEIISKQWIEIEKVVRIVEESILQKKSELLELNKNQPQ